MHRITLAVVLAPLPRPLGVAAAGVGCAKECISIRFWKPIKLEKKSPRSSMMESEQDATLH